MLLKRPKNNLIQFIPYSFIFKWIRNFLFIITVCTYGQERKLLNEILTSNADIPYKVQQADSLIDKAVIQKNDSLHYLQQQYATWLFDEKKIEKAIYHESQALAYSKSISHNTFSQFSALSLGYYYRNLPDILKSIDIYEQVLQINNKSEYAIRAYYQLGIAHLNIYDYYKAIEYFEHYASFFSSKEDEYSQRQLLKAYVNLTYSCLLLGEKKALKKGVDYANKALEIRSKVGATDLEFYEIHIKLAALNNQNESLNIPKALHHFEEALTIARRLNDSSKVIDIYKGIGNLYNTTQHDTAISYHEKALKLAKGRNIHEYEILVNLGYNYSALGNYEQGISTYLEALKKLTNEEFNDQNYRLEELLINSTHKIKLLNILPQIAESYLLQYQQEKDPTLLQNSLFYFLLADKTIDYLKINSSAHRSRLFWREVSSDIYGKALKVCYLLKDAEQAFYFMEKNKALLLMEDITKEKFKQSLLISQELLTEETRLKREVLLSELALRNEDSKILKDSIQNMHIKWEQSLKRLQDSIYKNSTNYPETTITSLTEVQNSMTKKDVIAEYHISTDDGYGLFSNNKNGYALFITNTDTFFYELQDLPKLKKDVFQLIEALRVPFANQEDIDHYQQLSYGIFKRLFPDDKVRQLLKNKNLTIVPDSYIGFLPFETLSYSEDQLNYLILNSEVSYSYSNSFMRNTTKSSNKVEKASFLGMAPVTFKDNTLPKLSNSYSELEALDNYYEGALYTEEQATKDLFLKELSQYAIIHLATHADATQENDPWISFEDEKLTLNELNLSRNNASLVMLSGCNTSIGKEEVGEGIMSLARGFFYGGSQSVIASLWSIDDTSTSSITKDFYQNLSEGQTKATALSNAKRSYLNNHQLSEQSPFYWGGLVLLGANDALPAQSDSNLLYYLLFSGILLFILYRYFKAKRATVSRN